MNEDASGLRSAFSYSIYCEGPRNVGKPCQPEKIALEVSGTRADSPPLTTRLGLVSSVKPCVWLHKLARALLRV